MVRGAFNLIPTEPVERMVALARRGEELGYERCWVYDEGLAARDVYVTLAAIAAATDAVEMGPGITNPYTRHAGATAGAIASLDELSGGRAFLGIGAGGSLTLDPLGIERNRPLAAVAEAIDACRRLLEGETVDADGRCVRLRQASLAWRAGRTGTEIWLAGRGPRMLELGGAACEGVMLDFVHKPGLAEAVGRIRAAGRAAGRSPQIAYSTMIVTDERVMAATKPHMTYRLVDSPPEVRAAIGLTDEAAGRIRAAMGSGLEAAAELVRDEWVHPFVLAGTASECAAELASLVAAHGIDEFVVPVLDDQGAENLLATAAEVLALGAHSRARPGQG